MIQDIYPYQYHVEYTPSAPSEEDYVFIFPDDGQVLLKSDGTAYCCGEIKKVFPDACLRYLFRIDSRSFFWMDSDPKGCAAGYRSASSGEKTEDAASTLKEDTTGRNTPMVRRSLCEADFRLLPGNPSVSSISVFRRENNVLKAFEGYTASHLVSWYRSSRFCGRCGSPMIDGTDERKLVCPHCGNILYPRINPSVIVAVYDGDRLLMTRYARRRVTWYVLVAGFIEVGESAEDTVRREVLEETGLHVKNIRYFGSQPWGIPGNLTLGYTAQLDGKDDLTIQKDELADGKWFRREDVPVRENDDLSITMAMIRAFKEGKF